MLAQTETLLMRLAKVGTWRWLGCDEEAPPAAVQVVGGLRVLVPLADLVDVAAERTRLKRALEKLGKDLARVEAKLANPNFVAKAPEAVVAKERAKSETLRQRQTVHTEELARLDAL